MLKAIAYPNFDTINPIMPSYNLAKWTQAMRDVYIKTHLGASKQDAVLMITKSWDKVEAKHFMDWMKYYESGDHLKYKKAQYKYYVNDDINFFVPNPQNVPSPLKAINDVPKEIEQAKTFVPENKEEKREIVEDIRKKILGRLNSAEKILSTQQGHIFAGKDFERLLIAIYELKKQIQTMNKVSLSTQTYVDLIIRQANILKRNGFENASSFMVKFAQNTPGDFNVNLGEIPSGGSQPNAGGSLGNNTPLNLTEKPLNKEDGDGSGKAINEFMENLEGAGFTDFDKNDVSNSDDDVVIDEDVFLDQDVSPSGKDDLVVEAQEMPANKENVLPKPKLPNENKIAPEVNTGLSKDIENKDLGADGIKPNQESNTIGNHVDGLIDSAFGDISINDIISKLEQVLDIFRNREITKQLVICDLMLNRLNLSSMFPNLGETIHKNYEVGAYSLSRLEDILSKLKGASDVKNQIDLVQPDRPVSPGIEQVKKNLEQSSNAEKERKKMRQQMQDQKVMENVNKPELEVEAPAEEIGAEPVQLKQPSTKTLPPPKPAPIAPTI